MSEVLKHGQKYPTPTPGFGDRVFYETLYRQRPDSEMARAWCLAYGVLSNKEAKKLCEAMGKNVVKKGAAGSVKRGSNATKKKKKKLKLSVEKDIDGDVGMSIGVSETVGMVSGI